VGLHFLLLFPVWEQVMGDNPHMPPGRPPKNGKPGKRWNIYCTEEDRAIVRSLLALTPEQKAYVKGWIDRGANIKGGGK